MQGQSTNLNNQTNISYIQQIPGGTSSNKNDRLHPAAIQQPHQTLPRMNIGVVPISSLMQKTQTPVSSMVPNSTSSSNYHPPPPGITTTITNAVTPTGMLHYRHTSMPTVSVSQQNLHRQFNVQQSSSQPAPPPQIFVQQPIQRQQRQNVQHVVVRTGAPPPPQNVHQNVQPNIPSNRQSVQVTQRQRVSNNVAQNNARSTRQNLPSNTTIISSSPNASLAGAVHVQMSQQNSGTTQIMGQNNPAHIMPQMVNAMPRNMPKPVQIIVPNPPTTIATTVSKAIPQTVPAHGLAPDPRSLPQSEQQTTASSMDLNTSSRQNAQVKEAQKLKALAYFGDMLNQSKYNEDDREFCREQRSTIADAMVEMGNDEGHSINELFEYYLLALEDEIDKKHPRIIERKEVLRLALNMAFIDVFQIGPDFDNAM